MVGNASRGFANGWQVSSRASGPLRRRGIVLLATLLAVLGLFAFLSLIYVQVAQSIGVGQQGEKRLREDITRVLDLPVAKRAAPASSGTPKPTFPPSAPPKKSNP